MPHYSYAFQHFDKTKHVRAALREKNISRKHSREVALAIKGLSIEKAREYLENVIAKKLAVPYRRYNNEVAHRSNIRDGFYAGRFPQKTAKEFLRLLDNLESNAEYKGMDLDRLRIINSVVHIGTKLERFTPRAMGRSSPKIGILVHIELVAKEGPA
ncbi:50S ribosomal protein L22 [Nitrososphaera sp. AFS]|jgi:large subunit ribosomal protein L22|uniref:50S ribosomal protein L22 n=1 Tax=Nitrososphaera sp. AFS TaxID=2301191 RepID=UPI0013922283|nr:50S ribosomal protein L22 [Nitrososphaera sp. AFS]NAL76763.1 50S ribosomal protein L22 [Nitrososphaera sp. AFS]